MASQKEIAHKIKLLPDSLANQIAAGEVILRPASAVKELLENAIDAQARRITVRIEHGGKQRIQVIDDGIGMDEVDARMSLERHATSKIASAEDLWRIQTMGFRGEALPSIAAVARIEILARTAAQTIGTRVVAEAGKVISQESASCEVGTTVTISNLFYYTPARKKFLRADHTEFNYIQEEFIRVALAHPDRTFSLIHNDEEIYYLLPGTLRQRIVQLFGKKWQKNLVTIEEKSPFGNISGYVAHPDVPRTRRLRTYLYVNRRYIKHPHLAYAIRKAYISMKGETAAAPFYVLLLDVSPDKVDVNIHPAKTEVKFHDEKSLFSFIYSTVRQRIASAALGEQLMFDEEEMQRALEKIEFEKQTSTAPKQASDPADATKSASSTSDQSTLPIDNDSASSSSTSPQALWVLDGMALVRMRRHTLLVDLQRALETYHFHQLNREVADIPSQALLVPEFVNLLPEEMTLLKPMQKWLERMGFDLDEFGELSYIVHAIPAPLGQWGNAQSFIQKAIEKYRETTLPEESARLRHGVAAAWADIAIPHLSPSETEAILAYLWSTPEAEVTPDNRRIYQAITADHLRLLLDK